MTHEEFWDNSVRKDAITLEQRRQIGEYYRIFEAKIVPEKSYIICVQDGFFGCGTLREKVPHDGVGEPINDIILIFVNPRADGSIRSHGIHMMKDEALDLVLAINKAIGEGDGND